MNTIRIHTKELAVNLKNPEKYFSELGQDIFSKLLEKEFDRLFDCLYYEDIEKRHNEKIPTPKGFLVSSKDMV